MYDSVPKDVKCLLKKAADDGICIQHILNIACGQGNIDCVKYLCEVCNCSPHPSKNRPNMDPVRVIEYYHRACKSDCDHLDIIKYLHKNYGCKPKLSTFQDFYNYQYIFEDIKMLKYFVFEFECDFKVKDHTEDVKKYNEIIARCPTLECYIPDVDSFRKGARLLLFDSLQEFIINLSTFSNKRMSKYLQLEMLEISKWNLLFKSHELFYELTHTI
jgi:hypothetical protein